MTKPKRLFDLGSPVPDIYTAASAIGSQHEITTKDLGTICGFKQRSALISQLPPWQIRWSHPQKESGIKEWFRRTKGWQK